MNRKVIVSGAGIAGLAVAFRLHQLGWEVLVVERAATRRSSGYMVNLLGQGYDAAERLGVLPQLAKRDLGAFTSILVKADGRQKLTVPIALAEAALGPRALTVFRGDLESVWYEAVRDSVGIRFDTTIWSIAQDPSGVDVVLSDGTAIRADLVIGADGLHSGVRQLQFGVETRFRRDLGLVVGAFPLEQAPQDIPEASGTTFIGPGRTAAVVNHGPGRSSAFFTYRTDDPTAEVSRSAADCLPARFGDLGGGVNNALEQLASHRLDAYFDSASQIVLDSWSRGRVVLLGDAAWCVTLFAGYGAALAIAGAEQLGSVLEAHRDDIPAGLAVWERALRPEVRKRQALARKGTSQYAPVSKAQLWARNALLRAIALPGVHGLVRYAIQRAHPTPKDSF